MGFRMVFGGPAVSGEFKAPTAKQALMEIDGFEMLNGTDTTQVFSEETGEELSKEQLALLASVEAAAQ